MSNPKSKSSENSKDGSSTNVALTASLVGWYGFENAGDDAFFAILCKWMIQEFGVERIRVSGCHSRLPKTAAHLPAQIEGNETERVLGRVERFFHEPKNLFGHDVVVFGGGSIFAVRRFWWLAVQVLVLKAMRRMGFNRTALAGIGISIGPFRRKNHNFWCRQALRLYDVVMVRDEKSAAIGRDYRCDPLLASLDLALVLPSFYVIAERTPRQTSADAPAIGFSLVDRDTENGVPEIDDAKREAIVKSLLGLAEKYPKAEFKGFVFCKHSRAGDYAATQKVLAPLREAGCRVQCVEYDNDPVSLCGQIADLDVMVCNRMHSFVFSCITKTPAVMISYAPKMAEFAKTVGLCEDLFFQHDSLEPDVLQLRLSSLIESQQTPCDNEILINCRERVLADLSEAADQIRHVLAWC